VTLLAWQLLFLSPNHRSTDRRREVMASRRKVDSGAAESPRSLPHGSVKEMNEALIGIFGSCLGAQESLRTLCLGLEEAQRELQELRQALGLTRQEMREQVRELHERWDDLQRKLGDTRANVDLLLIARQETADVPPLPGNLKPVAISPPIRLEDDDLNHKDPDHYVPRRKAALGVTVDPDAKVVDVLPGTPAEKAGIQPGDLLLGVDGTPVASSEELRTVIRESEAGKEVVLTVCRGEQRAEVMAQLAQPNGATILDEERVN
jgi:predicted metalloprotease with PDZ domain